jgi:hypothetical protein
VYFHVNLNFSKFNKKCICWWENNFKLVSNYIEIAYISGS